MKLLILALLPLLARASFDKACVDRKGNPISSKPFRIPSNCDGFYQCSNGYLSTQNCPAGTVFNPALRVCDWPSNVPDCKLFSITACENKEAEASCPSGSAIIVKDGFYGRDDGETCPHSSIKTTTCSAEGSLSILKDSCNGKNTCNLQPTNGVFGDPCVGTYKYIEMNYYCRPIKVSPRWRKEVICEHESREVSCPADEVIWVRRAFYGRDDSSTCPSNSILTTECAADGSLTEVRRNCNGKNSCVVTASNSIFGDPCVGTFKYVEMVYVCRPSRWQTVTVCEGHSQSISCDAGQAIAIRSGYYGRSDGSTCPHSSIKTTRCAASGSFRSLRRTCHGKSSCTVEANNNVFGDPCVGTYKYVELSYRCRNKRELCVDANGNPISSDPFTKPGDCNHFYQCSNGILHTLPCAEGTVFNPKLGVCDWPHNVPGC